MKVSRADIEPFWIVVAREAGLMSLHPDAQLFLDHANRVGAAPFHELSVEQARLQVQPAEPPFVAMARIVDFRAEGPDREIPMRSYVPTNAKLPYPAIVFYHGGGWVTGTLDAYEGLCRQLAHASGAVVFSVDYRLAPEHKYPAAVNDCYQALCWVSANAGDLNLDAGAIGVAGDSAGGNLAAAVTIMSRDRGGPAIAHQCLLYPITNHAFDTHSYRENSEGFFLTQATMRWFWNHYLKQDQDGAEPYASPLRALSFAGLPTALVLTAQYDPLRDEGEAYADRLDSMGVVVTRLPCPGLIHGFLRRPREFEVVERIMDRIGRFVRDNSRGNTSNNKE